MMMDGLCAFDSTVPNKAWPLAPVSLLDRSNLAPGLLPEQDLVLVVPL